MDEILTHVTTWMNLKKATYKGPYIMISFIENVQNRQIYRDKKQISG